MAQEKVFKETVHGKILEVPGLTPLYLASKETTDPQIISYVETLFWTHSFKDHTEVIAALLPDKPELKEYKESALHHMEIFSDLNEKAREIDQGAKELGQILDDAEKHGEMIVNELGEILEKQEKGKIKTLMWPSFINHLIREGEYFLDQKEMISENKVEYKKSEIIPFWTEIMAEHTLFTAHLLDPEEIDPIDQVWEANFKLYEDLDTFEKKDDSERLSSDLSGLIKLKTTLLDGVQSGEIGSIIMPELAEHMRHEAIYFRDILARAN